MQKSTENVAKSLKVCSLIEKLDRRMEPRCLNLHRKFIHVNNRFCACAVQMLLKMAVNVTTCSTFKVQYGKSTSSRTTTIRHFRATLTEPGSFCAWVQHAKSKNHSATEPHHFSSMFSYLVFVWKKTTPILKVILSMLVDRMSHSA